MKTETELEAELTELRRIMANGVDERAAAPDDEREAIADEHQPAPGNTSKKRVRVSTDWRTHLLLNEEGNPRRALENVVVMLSQSPTWKDALQFNAFGQRIETTRPIAWRDGAPSAAGTWEDATTTRLVAHVERELGFSLAAGQVYAAVDLVARRATVNPLLSWLESLKWDGVSRVDTALSDYLGVEDSPYVRDVARWFLLGAVARAFRPGCKLDNMVVLEGPQGARKSSALRTLFGEEYFSDTPLDLQSKDRFVGLQGTWCNEVAELDGFDRAEANRIKSFLSSATDSYRPPYARNNVKIPRVCVFAGTTNTEDWQKDPTGGRRFWPVKVGAIDLARLERDREQLWAEAVVAYRAGVKWWPETTDEHDRATEEQRDRVALDPWHELIAEFIGPRLEIALGDVLSHVLGGSNKARWDQFSQNRMVRTLKILGFERKRKRVETRLTWVYRKG